MVLRAVTMCMLMPMMCSSPVLMPHGGDT
jgi:hypothetical protein